jgi:CheY-like chemotaxis protein
MADSDKANTQVADTARRILIADDDPAILRLVATILEKEHFSVVTARDGREAYKILQTDANFTAAILDVVMPHISGPELVRQMKTEQRLANIPVMMMTAEQDPKLSQDSFAAGAVVFLPKPFTTAQLQIMMQMLIGKTSRADEA